jgi:hypothetical protein
MKRLNFITGLIFLCIAFLFSCEKEVIKICLTLIDCHWKALEDNPYISIATFNPEISEVSILKAEEKF